MHKIIQHEDGTLSLGYVDGILNKYTDNTALKVMAQSETGVARVTATIRSAVMLRTFQPPEGTQQAYIYRNSLK